MHKTRSSLTSWESRRFKSVGNRYSTHFHRNLIRAGSEFESWMSHLPQALPAWKDDSGY